MLSEREKEVAESLWVFGRGREWARPMDIGGRDASHHSMTLARLSKKGLVERKERGGVIRTSYLYRSAKEPSWTDTPRRPPPLPPQKPYDPRSVARRFWAKVDRSGGPDACWPWTAGVADKAPGKNYGAFGVCSGKVMRAHRFSWMLHNGAIPEGFHVLHSCDNPSCVNPAHLRVGTNADNASDRVNRNRQGALIGEECPSAKLNEQAVKVIRFFLGRKDRQLLARVHGVSNQLISRINLGQVWRGV